MQDEAATETRGYVLHRPVVLVGMMGSGKTAIGRALAQRLGVAFMDSDAEIVAAAGQSIADIFEKYGEDHFREGESRVIARLMDDRPAVLSTGGGAFLSERNRNLIAEKGVSLWLDADLDLLWDRVRHKDTRPLLRTPDPYATLSEIYAARVPIYAKAELRALAERDLTIENMTDRVIEVLLAQPGLLERS